VDSNDVAAKTVAVVGAGPAGLRAAEAAAARGGRVVICDGQPSAGRKFLVAGRGGLNLTHSEPSAQFRTRFPGREAEVGRWLDGHTPVHAEARTLLQTAAERLGLSARGYHRVLKVARTIADLEDVTEVASAHVAEALRYRPRVGPATTVGAPPV